MTLRPLFFSHFFAIFVTFLPLVSGFAHRLFMLFHAYRRCCRVFGYHTFASLVRTEQWEDYAGLMRGEVGSNPQQIRSRRFVTEM